jgi:uncharacterized protein YPO0396
VLGFDNRDKLEHFRAEVGRLQAERTRLDQQLEALGTRRGQAGQHALSCQTLMNLRWEDIDVATQLDLIDGLQTELRQLREGDRDLAELGRQIDAAKAASREAETALSQIRGQRADIDRRRNEHNRALAELDRDLADQPIESAPLAALTARFEAPRAPLTLANLDSRACQVERDLHTERSAAENERNRLVTLLERQFDAFRRTWSMAAADLGETLASAPEYMRLLTGIEQDGLPRFEERFAALLKDQNTENLAALSRHVDEARRQIRERMALVNEGLAEAEFNTGTHLQIQVSERQLPDVLAFREQVREVLEHVWTTALDAADVESRFKTLSAIVARLAAASPTTSAGGNRCSTCACTSSSSAGSWTRAAVRWKSTAPAPASPAASARSSPPPAWPGLAAALPYQLPARRPRRRAAALCAGHPRRGLRQGRQRVHRACHAHLRALRLPDDRRHVVEIGDDAGALHRRRLLRRYQGAQTVHDAADRIRPYPQAPGAVRGRPATGR